MRLLIVLIAALALAPSAFAHAAIDPDTAKAGKPTAIRLFVPTESETAATVAVRVTAPAGMTLSGTTSWRGRTRGTVTLTFTAEAAKGGDYALRVEQRYSDGRKVAWDGPESSDNPAPVLHVQGTENTGRDRAIILGAAIAALLVVFALRRRRAR